MPSSLNGLINESRHGFGAQEKTRTSTTYWSLAPEASASTNSATWATSAEQQVGRCGRENSYKADDVNYMIPTKYVTIDQQHQTTTSK